MTVEMICADCGKTFAYEFKPNGHRQYCDECNKKKKTASHSRSDGQRFRRTRHASTGIQEILDLAPEYGLAPYDYGKIMTKLAWGGGTL